ncbi:MAG: hypothetical protein GY768_18135 [Planctomycetaceae bacterium]|nr:hypothetical protein [Planctomycetaceae bacterium]
MRILAMLLLPCWAAPCLAQLDIELAPFKYSKTADNNQITELIDKLKSGDVTLEYDAKHGYLKSLLEALRIPVSSQVLVFSKTSMQFAHISPQRPRAIYFGDDVYVAWVRETSIMEISTTDPTLGAAFYTLRATPKRATIKRQLYNCLSCHVSTLTKGVPGHTVRSVLPNPDGTIDPKRKSHVTDHKSPLAERWGGWYVTGKHGEMEHMGNAVVRNGQLLPANNGNQTDLKKFFYTKNWLTPHSDIVALMVLEHQTQMQNTFTLANFTIRRAQHEHNGAYGLGGPETNKTAAREATRELELRTKLAAKKIVDYMLFVDEAKVTSEVQHATQFASDFASRGPTDKSGRSLRKFNLKTRLFQYPCSYLIYSPAFDALEKPLRNEVYLQLWNVLTGKDQSSEYSHLNGDTRTAILEILQQTKAQLPPYWHRSE